MTIYFLYLLIFTKEENRISNETVKMGAFLCAILTLIAYLNQRSKYNMINQYYPNRRGDYSYHDYDSGYYKDNFRHREDNNLLTM